MELLFYLSHLYKADGNAFHKELGLLPFWYNACSKDTSLNESHHLDTLIVRCFDNISVEDNINLPNETVFNLSKIFAYKEGNARVERAFLSIMKRHFNFYTHDIFVQKNIKIPYESDTNLISLWANDHQNEKLTMLLWGFLKQNKDTRTHSHSQQVYSLITDRRKRSQSIVQW